MLIPRTVWRSYRTGIQAIIKENETDVNSNYNGVLLMSSQILILTLRTFRKKKSRIKTSQRLCNAACGLWAIFKHSRQVPLKAMRQQNTGREVGAENAHLCSFSKGVNHFLHNTSKYKQVNDYRVN